MAVGADHGVGERDAVAHHDDAREVLDIDLVDDPGAGRDNLEVIEGRLPPTQELVALSVSPVFDVGVDLERVRATENVCDDRVVDD